MSITTTYRIVCDGCGDILPIVGATECRVVANNAGWHYIAPTLEGRVFKGERGEDFCPVCWEKPRMVEK